jgi:TM2 domain-containing membrane protein YozV
VFCPFCGTMVEENWRYCKRCGQYLRGFLEVSETPVTLERSKDPTVALILALVPGLFGIWGIGHIYVGEITKGILLLFGGIILGIIMILFTFFCWIIILILGFFIWIWQAYDAYRIAKETQASPRYY